MHVIPSIVGHAALVSHMATTPLFVHWGGVPPVSTMVPQQTGEALPQSAGLRHARPPSPAEPLLDPELDPELDVEPELDPEPLLLPELEVEPPLLLPLPPELAS